MLGGSSMSKVVLSESAFETLIKHLVNIEEKKRNIIDYYFPHFSKEREEFEKYFEEYIRQIDQLIRKSVKGQTACDNLPFVTIGSEIKVEELTEHKIYMFRLVSPFDENIGMDDVSFLSPVGKSLLLKRIDDEVTVNVPDGIFNYKIKSIKLH